MLDSAQPKRSDDEKAGAFREALHGRAEFIEHKFAVKRAFDIKPDYLMGALNDISVWSQSNIELPRPDIIKTRNLEDNIYAAMTLYEEPENRNEYFAKLRIIADQLKRI